MEVHHNILGIKNPLSVFFDKLYEVHQFQKEE